MFADVEIYSNKNTYLVGEHIKAHFNNLDSYGSDWIGIYEIGSPNESYLYWKYTDGTQENNYNFLESGYVYFSPLTLPVGEYEVRLFYDNSYELVVSFPFQISDSCIEELISSNFNDTFRAMTFNIWHSGQNGYGGLERISEIISDLSIDIIGFQETSYSSLIEIQILLNNYDGYENLYIAPSEYSDWNTRILSKYPIIEIYDYNLYGIGASLKISDDDTLKFISSHLTAYPYGPYDIIEGYSIEEVMENELLYHFQENLDIYNQIIINPDNKPHLPVIYVGDHNAPSILDWTTENTDQNFGNEFDWPVSDFLLNNNFFDSYREINISVYDFTGLTWSPGYPKNSFDSWDVHDRIDMIYYKNGENKVLYPLESYIYDCDPWPSDHRAVITEFAICINSNIGDINSDYIINIQDILILIDGILNSYDSYCFFHMSDFDMNGDLNVIDIIRIVNIILSHE